jgi:porin
MTDKLSSPFFVFALFFSAYGPYAVAADSETNWLQRETRTGDCNGSRNQLAENGVKVDFEFTGYYQGMFSGSGYDDFDLGGRVDGLVTFDTKKLGLWEGGSFHTHLTYRAGDLLASRGGALMTVSTGSIVLFGEKDSLVATSIYPSQRIGDSRSLLIGKVNALDLAATDPFFGGYRDHREISQ